MQIDALDHFVMTVADIAASCDFYSRVLGLEIIAFGDNRKALKIGNQKINLHQSGKEIHPCAGKPCAGSADLCFISDLPIPAVIDHLSTAGVPVELGPVPRTGARGPMMSVYIRDPDENLVEISNYP